MKRRVYRAGAVLALLAAAAAITIVLAENGLHTLIGWQVIYWPEAVRAIAAALGGYLFGSIPFGFIIIGVLRERDITEEGSGRTGGTNALRAGGFGAAALTVTGDLLKGLAGVTLARIIFAGNLWAEVLAGWGVILGHNASIYLAFRGGAGTAPNMGVAAGFWFPSLIFTLPFFPIGMFVIRIASLTSLVAGLAIVAIFAVRALLGQGPWEYVAYGLGALLLVAYALRPNIQRLLQGTESWVDLRAQEKEKRTYQSARLSPLNLSHLEEVSMTNVNTGKKRIAILTGGGDVPGLNPAIRAVTIRALREGWEVIGLRRGWAGVIDIVREKDYDNNNNFQYLTEEIVNRAGRTGGTFLHTSRTRPSTVKADAVPDHLKDQYQEKTNDLTSEVLKNLDWLGIDYLIPIGGDDTLSYGVRLYQEGVKVIAIPKTMDNDVPGTDYCIGFSTCVTRTIEMANRLRTSAGSHERLLVLEVFGRYAGFTAMLPTMAGAANRCVIPEHKFNMDKLTELLMYDRALNPSKYAICLISEGAMYEGGEMVFQNSTTDAFGHAKLGGIGDLVSAEIQKRTAQHNKGKEVNIINQKLGYLVRGGDPDAIDSIVPMAYGNLALDLLLNGIHGRLVVLKNGRYDNIPLDIVTSTKKLVNVDRFYNTSRYRPHYKSFEMTPLFIMTSEG